MVTLDAGEGFTSYKWTPTNDTTQWIVVKNTGEYFVKVTDNFGCIGSDDTKVKRRCGVQLHIPNSFTPNADGINDIFVPVGLDIETYRISIYNRWGQLVFNSNNLTEGWDGNFNNKPAESGVYIYKIDYQGYKNKQLQQFTRTGNLTLMR